MLRTETVYLVDANGDPYTQVDHWHDRWILDDDGNETDEAESFLIFHARRSQGDEEISQEEYESLLPAFEQRQRDHLEAVAAHQVAQGEAHRALVESAAKKLKKRGLTEAEAIALAPFIGNTGEGNAE